MYNPFSVSIFQENTLKISNINICVLEIIKQAEPYKHLRIAYRSSKASFCLDIQILLSVTFLSRHELKQASYSKPEHHGRSRS